MTSILLKKTFKTTVDIILIVSSLYYSIATTLLFVFGMFLPSNVALNDPPNLLYIASLVAIMIYGSWVFIDTAFLKSKVISKYLLLISIFICLLSFFNYLSFFGVIPGMNVASPMFEPLQIVFLFTTIIPLLYMTKYYTN